MDKSWIDLESKTRAYLRGIDAFLDFAFKNRPNDTTISCPCEKCDNRYFKSRIDIRDHCFFNGFSKNYKNWTYHGESYVPIQRPTVEASRFQNNEGDNIVGLLYEAMGIQHMSDNELGDGESSENNDLSGANKETLQFYQMLEDASLELYPMHLAEEAIIGGPIQYRWMYPIERYLHDVETRASKTPRNYDGGNEKGRLVGNEKEFHIDHVTWVQAHRYVLQNSNAVKSYHELHITQLKSEFPRANTKRIESLHHERFHDWFKEYVENLRLTSGEMVSEDVVTLSQGPSDWGRRYKVCVVHGFKFRIKSLDAKKKTQNSGVFYSA